LGEVVGSTPYYLLDDALGSIRDVTTATPVNTVFSSNYEPYGHSYGLTQSLAIFNFEYTHKPYDTATGFYYFGARYYDPAIERFVTEDSMMYSMNIQNPLSLNRYIYALNNPETFNDPDGHMIGFPDHYGSYNDLLQVEEEENIDVGITLTEDVQEQNGEESSTTSSSTTVVTSESPTTVTTTTSVTTTATSEGNGITTSTTAETTTTTTTLTRATSASRYTGKITLTPPGETEAIGLTALVLVGSGALLVFGEPAIALSGPFAPAIDAGIISGDIETVNYLLDEGPNANAEGVGVAWVAGFGLGFGFTLEELD
jgi:RHS repeat-associated protein